MSGFPLNKSASAAAQAGAVAGAACYERWLIAPLLAKPRRQRAPTVRELAHKVAALRAPHPPSEPDPVRVSDPKPRRRARWKRGSIWRYEYARWLAEGDRRDSTEGINSVPHALPFLAKAGGFNAERVSEWVREKCPVAALGPEFERLVARACEGPSPRYNACRFGRAIGISPEDRRSLRITMIRSEAKAEIDKARAAVKVAYKRDLRAFEAEREGRAYTPREASVAAQARRAGVPLRTFWRRLKEARETASDAPVGTVSDPSVGTVSGPACVKTHSSITTPSARHKHAPSPVRWNPWPT